MVKLAEAKLTSQGQISVPKLVRERLHLQGGAKVVFFEDEEGHIILEEAEIPFGLTQKQWEEFIAKTEKEPVTEFRGKAAALRHLDRLMRKK
ncbi:MAG: AbrB/MazE/SpoVT family DNA-binding domain-containing protein [Candidatus Omnitrophica bacterium]|nr:AbrB/MazE/SpoVT family DNA-binding domain-containing protein [Candidatus Omnitrophota bacterium]